MSFSEEKARQKLIQLNNTQQSIQTTSQWCLFHYRHSKDIVQLWFNMFLYPDSSIDQSEQNYKLTLFYLCNDLVQFAKKKESKFKSYLKEFSEILPQIIENISSDSTNAHLKEKYSRVLNVWNQRSIFPSNFILNLQNILNNKSSKSIILKEIPITKENNINHNITPNSNIIETNIDNPKELESVISQYKMLDNLYNSYKSNYIDFNKLVNKILNEYNNDTISTNNDNNGNTNGDDQLNTLLSSLSSLQGNNTNISNIDNNDNKIDIKNSKINQDLKKINEAKELGIKIESQSNKITKLRTDIATELRKLASELDDWIMLDKGKQFQISNTIKEIENKKLEITKDKEDVSNLNNNDENDMNDDDENIPTYADNDVSDSDSDDGFKNNSDSDDAEKGEEEEREKEKEDDVNIKKRSLDKYNDTDDDINSESGNESSKENEKKRNKKSVSFANDTETLLFDKEEMIKPLSVPKSQLEETQTSNQEAPETSNQESEPPSQPKNQDLEALLGMLK